MSTAGLSCIPVQTVVVRTTTPLPFIPIPVIRDVELLPQHDISKETVSAVEVESSNVGVLPQ